MKENTSGMIQDEFLETVSGGNDAQYDEILQYVNLSSQMRTHYGRSFQSF